MEPSEEFPRVYAVLMDWPLAEAIATVLGTSHGGASLYTTSTFGIIGGEGHESVKAAAKVLVKASDGHLGASSPTTEFPYPDAGHVRFCFVTFDGVRVIEQDLPVITNGTSECAELFGLAQMVLTELRRVTEKR